VGAKSGGPRGRDVGVWESTVGGDGRGGFAEVSTGGAGEGGVGYGKKLKEESLRPAHSHKSESKCKELVETSTSRGRGTPKRVYRTNWKLIPGKRRNLRGINPSVGEEKQALSAEGKKRQVGTGKKNMQGKSGGETDP